MEHVATMGLKKLPEPVKQLNWAGREIRRPLPVLGAVFLFALTITVARAQTDCLMCHSDKTMQDSKGHSIAVDGKTFDASVHGALGCSACHADIKEYPHPEHVTKVECKSCHADQAAALQGSVHAESKDHPCTSCHGDAHSIFPKTDVRSTVYPLNIPNTCGKCHGTNGMAAKHGLKSTFPSYMDSIHGFALSQEGLLVAANCQSCHGSHHILSSKNPASPTYRTNIPKTCGTCHAKIEMKYDAGAHGHGLAKGDKKAPVCTDCHTAHAIVQPTESNFRANTTPLCGGCHEEKLSTYHDTFHSQLGLLGGYVQTARCWDCHGAHDVLPASDPKSMIAPANLVTTCSKCHAGANARFVKYQPHADAYNFKQNPALYLIRMFMNVLLISVLTFFLIHTILWIVRSRREHMKRNGANGGNHG
ncbi:MAG: hypothetical protein KGN79_00055 [Acidobacteriota bacterium]|nr:hypothetical protein [Acidobacteriota bacterium]